MASLTIRNIPEDAKLRFRQVAAAHGRSMEEHLRQLVINAGFAGDRPMTGEVTGVRDVKQSFRHEPSALASFSGTSPDADKAARIRAMSSKEFIDHLIATAAGANLELPERTVGNDREIFGAD